MKHIYKGPGLLFLAVLVISTGCSKDSYYPVENKLKPLFVFQPGSYWIYENDSTGSTDSVWVLSTNRYTSDFDNTTKPKEIISVYFKSSFLESIRLIGQPPGESTGATVTTWVADDPSSSNSKSLLPVFSHDWPPAGYNNQDTSKPWYVTDVEIISYDTINNLPFTDILYNYTRSKDSSATNSRFLFRKIWIAKNVGIIKIIEKYRYFDIERSYSLIRYHAVQ